MKKFQNAKVRTKMIISFMLVILLMATLAVLAVIELNNVAGTYRYAIDNPMECEMQMRMFDYATNEVRRLSANMVMFAPANDPDRIDGYHNLAKQAHADGLAALEVYREILRTGSAAADVKANALKNLDELEETFTAYMTNVCDPLAMEAREGNYDAAIGYVAAGVELGNMLTEQTNVLTETAENSANANIIKAEEGSAKTVLLIIGISAGAAIIAVFVALYVAGLVSKPLLPLVSFMKKASTTGDLSLSQSDIEVIGKYAQLKDELGQTIEASAAFVNYVTEVSRKLTAIAEGDLTQETQPLSDKDTIGMALENMLNNLNSMFGEINSSASQVSVGSKQVADGAQSLAQGSTEQAASIEELSSSINEIAQKTKKNTEMTERAAKLADVIKDNAQDGSRHMDEMISAVNDINEVSRSISKIINTIDDIAFQTNILALNAAVEAARAGQHGKGFAVVAEEVRNLADKSAQAAKETSVMIEDSAGKAEAGAKIASETAESLAKIVSDLEESTQLVGEIAKSSEEQSEAISQINEGVDQVAQVVQQNSATAQESAAASEQMNGQSEVLQQLISQFKLKEGEPFIYNLPASDDYHSKQSA